MHQPLISVIVPVYNVEKYLQKCVDSIRNQTYSNLEIFLVDDGSTDGCSKICDEYALIDDRIRVFHKENGGQGTARNLALDHATGDYIAFVDSDDYIELNMYETMVAAAESEDADMALCGFVADSGLKKYTICPIAEPTVFTNEELLREYATTSSVLGVPWNKLYRSFLLKDVRFPPFRAHEDVYVMPELLVSCKKAVHVGQALYVQSIREGSTETSPFSEKNLCLLKCAKRLIEVYKKHCPQLLHLVAYKSVNDTVALMRKIICTFSYIKYKTIYQNLKSDLRQEYKSLVEQYPDREGATDLLKMAVDHYGKFCIHCLIVGCKRCVKRMIKFCLGK